MNQGASESRIGSRMRRVEDLPLITGHGCYVDDIHLEGMLHLDVLRSPHAHARIASIDTTVARTLPGVVAIYTAADFENVLPQVPGAHGLGHLKVSPHHILATNRVRYAGEGVAAVLATDRYRARDALESIHVEYEVLEAVHNVSAALRKDASVIHACAPGNIAFTDHVGDERKHVRDRVTRVVKGQFVNQRVIPSPMETRGAVATFDPWKSFLTIWLSTQAPHLMRREFSRFLGFPEHRIRVVAPDVGGAFGAKNNPYSEELLVAVLALRHHVPVKWVEERQEHMLATSHGRAQTVDVEAGVDERGKLITLHYRLVADMGAYYHAITPVGPYMTAATMTSCYAIEEATVDIVSVFTNATPVDPYRGFGRAEAVYFAERTMDLIAHELQLDPIDVRRRNLIDARSMPFTTATGHVHESGDFTSCLDRVLDLLDVATVRVEQKRLREADRFIGVGVSTFAWRCGYPSPKGGAGYVVGGWEKTTISMDPAGKVHVVVGTSPHGQGVATAMAQIVAHELGIPVEDIQVKHGDTEVAAQGNGTMGSRSLVVGGSATLLAARKLREHLLEVAAHLLDLSRDGVVFECGTFADRENPARSVSLENVAAMSYSGAPNLPEGMSPALMVHEFFEQPNFACAYGAHACVVEVEPKTGAVKILKYVAVDDVGNAINPMIIEGQLHGGIAQGIGQALMEECRYDESGLPIAASFLDYAIPRATDVPRVEVALIETPSTVNPLGARGIGEAGAVAAPPTVVNAVIDALAPFGVREIDMPLTAEKIWKATGLVQK